MKTRKSDTVLSMRTLGIRDLKVNKKMLMAAIACFSILFMNASSESSPIKKYLTYKEEEQTDKDRIKQAQYFYQSDLTQQEIQQLKDNFEHVEVYDYYTVEVDDVVETFLVINDSMMNLYHTGKLPQHPDELLALSDFYEEIDGCEIVGYIEPLCSKTIQTASSIYTTEVNQYPYVTFYCLKDCPLIQNISKQTGVNVYYNDEVATKKKLEELGIEMYDALDLFRTSKTQEVNTMLPECLPYVQMFIVLTVLFAIVQYNYIYNQRKDISVLLQIGMTKRELMKKEYWKVFFMVMIIESIHLLWAISDMINSQSTYFIQEIILTFIIFILMMIATLIIYVLPLKILLVHYDYMSEEF